MPTETKVKTNLGRVSIVPKGIYDPEKTYERLDYVRYGDDGYLARKSGLHGVTPEDGEDWMKAVGSGSAAAAKSWAIGEGMGDERPDEATNNAKYYAEQTRADAEKASNAERIVTEHADQLALVEQNIKAIQSAPENAQSAKTDADRAQSYAVGKTSTREGEDVDNAAYYYEQAKRVAQGIQGALQPHGSIRFEDLSGTDKQPGWMYNVTDAFTTDDTFVEGEGHAYPPGTNVYCTADMLWDCLPGVMVTSVRGEAEPVGRQGDVIITPANIGAYKKSDVDAKIDAATSRVYTVTVPASGWQPSTATWPEAGLTAKWENTVSVPGMTPDVTLAPGNIAFAGGSLADAQRWRWINTDTDTITVYSDRDTAPAADYTWTITEVR